MTRVFGRGQLKAAVLAAVARSQPANGYTVMATLAETVGGQWRPSPGAIYPALLALEDAGLIHSSDDGDGARLYSLTPAGRAQQGTADEALADAARRSQSAEPTLTLGRSLDDLPHRLPGRHTRLTPDQAIAIGTVLTRAAADINDILDKEQPDG